MEKKLFAFDIDGTLLNDNKQVLPSTKKAIEKLLKLDHVVILSTGRLPVQTRDFVLELGLKHYIVGAAGALIYSISTKETEILSPGIPLREKKELYRLCKQYQRELSFNDGISFSKVYFGNDVESEIKDELFYIGGSSRIPIYDDWKKVKKFFLKKKIIQASFKAESELTEKVYEYLKNYISKNVSVHETSRVYAELGIDGLNKYTAIQKILEKENISENNVYCFGDSDNDFEMISSCINGVAMGNAKERIKKVAKYTIGTNNQNSIYDFLVKQKIISN